MPTKGEKMLKKTTYYMFAFGFLAFLATGCGKEEKCEIPDGAAEPLIDSSDNNRSYKTVSIGCQTWMAENYAKVPAGGSGYYHVNGDAANDAKYGLLYNWETAIDMCPSGWHLPTENEFHQFNEYVDAHNTSNLGLSLIARSTDWTDYSEKGTDEFGFAALPAGAHSGYDNTYFYFGEGAGFWSKTYYEKHYATMLSLGPDSFSIDGDYKLSGHSIRCIKDTAKNKGDPKTDFQPTIGGLLGF